MLISINDVNFVPIVTSELIPCRMIKHTQGVLDDHASLILIRVTLRICAQILTRTYFLRAKTMVGRGGLEPPTSRLSGVRSNHLSYRPNSAANSCRIAAWWSLSGSNR